MSQGDFFYFEFFGRGETIRMLLSHSKIKWNDVRLTQEKWATSKELESFKGKQLPVWIDKNGSVFNESKATLRYLGTIYGYYPKDAKLAWACDKMVD